jgi:hypothetical protein
MEGGETDRTCGVSPAGTSACDWVAGTRRDGGWMNRGLEGGKGERPVRLMLDRGGGRLEPAWNFTL